MLDQFTTTAGEMEGGSRNLPWHKLQRYEEPRSCSCVHSNVPPIRRYNVTMLKCFPRCIDVCMPPGDYMSAETFIKPKKMQPFIVILLRQSTRREKSPRSCWSRWMELIKRCGCGSGFPGTIERRKSSARDLQPTVEPAAAESLTR